VDTLKTAIVVVLLLAVLYIVYTVLNKSDVPMDAELAWNQSAMEPLQVDFGGTPPLSGAAPGQDANAGFIPGSEGGAIGSRSALPPLPTRNEAGLVTGTSSPWGNQSVSPAAGANFSDATPLQPTVQAAEAWGAPKPTAVAPQLLDPAVTADNSQVRSANPAEPIPTDPTGGDSVAGVNLSGGGDPTADHEATAAGGSSNTQLDQAAAGFPPGYDPARTASPAAVMQPVDTLVDGGADRGGEPAGRLSADGLPPTGPELSRTESSTNPSRAAVPANGILNSASQSARDQINQGQYYEALLTLSYVYQDPELTAAERESLLPMLDSLAAEVIYSTAHHMEPEYTVQPNETLPTIAEQHQVSWQLLANINGLTNADAIEPGRKLKVVRGPFHAKVDLTRRELTLFVRRLYAGRFPIEVGAQAPAPANYSVLNKYAGQTFYMGNAQTLAADDPANPYGGIWIELGDQLGIHAQPSQPEATQTFHSISLSPRDANDLFGILARGSSVMVVR